MHAGKKRGRRQRRKDREEGNEKSGKEGLSTQRDGWRISSVLAQMECPRTAPGFDSHPPCVAEAIHDVRNQLETSPEDVFCHSLRGLTHPDPHNDTYIHKKNEEELTSTKNSVDGETPWKLRSGSLASP